MKRYIFLAAVAFAFMQVAAQETYENTKLVDNDLNGTARYMGMGGATDALGADLSTINTNPAGIGLFRHSTGSVSFGVVSQQGANNFANGHSTNMSFDQAGFVYAMRSGNKSFLNFAFNYHKGKNFDYILSAGGNLNGSSQNKLSFLKALGANGNDGASTFNIEEDENGYLWGTQAYTNQLDNLYYNNFIVDQSGTIGYNNANNYNMQRANTGYIGEYDFNLSGNVNDRFYWGVTFGLYDVHYKGFSTYTENMVDINDQSVGTMSINDERRITGTGFDIKLGAIFRPIENSPFRIGVYVQTPTWYDLTTTNYTTLANNTDIQGYNNSNVANNSYSYKVYTPWKFGINLGHTIGNYLALGASYEYADYGSMDTRINDGGSYDWYYDTYYETSYSDDNMNYHTSKTLKGVSTIKLGAEYKPVSALAVRLGYNYVSPMFNKNGFKDGSIDSYGSNYSSATDYTNWGATNRFTVGLGYNIDKFTVDLAYVYNVTNGEFHPFMDAWGDYNYIDGTTNQVVTDQIDNYTDAVKVSDKRHQLVLTLSYRF